MRPTKRRRGKLKLTAIKLGRALDVGPSIVRLLWTPCHEEYELLKRWVAAIQDISIIICKYFYVNIFYFVYMSNIDIYIYLKLFVLFII
jgi:hypothetical protein